LAQVVRGWQPARRFRDWRRAMNVCRLGDPAVECSEDGSVIALKLSQAGIRGNLSDELGKLTALTSLQLDGNQLTGYLPWSLSALTNLQIL
ncbi:unnamed protein product, partial [Closterium sp. NIES-64]